MNKFYTLLIALSFTINISAQEQSTSTGTVEKSMFNIQTGLVGFWASYEARLSDRWTLRTEAGLDLWAYETNESTPSGTKTETGTALVPSISLEPRWYYNIAKRNREGKHTVNNSANFITVAIEYYPDLFLIGSVPDDIYVPDQISIIPKWGMRRSIANSNFNYELGGGVGYTAYLEEAGNMKQSSDVAIDFHARIGYTF
jgi:hypothetical protein